MSGSATRTARVRTTPAIDNSDGCVRAHEHGGTSTAASEATLWRLVGWAIGEGLFRSGMSWTRTQLIGLPGKIHVHSR